MPGREPEPPTPAVPRRRARSAWLARGRYRRARWAAAATGGLLVAALIGSALAEAEAARVPLDARFLVTAALWLAAGTAGPWLLLRALWRRARHRNRWRWQ